MASLQSELATVNSALGDKSLAPDLRAELEREAARLREEIEIARVARSGEEQPPAATATPAVKAEQTLRSKAPDLVVRMSGGGEFDLSKQSGRATVVQFFATWSAPCKRALPELARLSKDLDGKADVVVIRVLSRDEKQDAKAAGGQERALTAATDLLRSIGAGALGERAAVDADGSISARWQTVAAVPDVYLIAPDGSVAQRWQGLGKETYSEIRRAVDLLNPKPPEAQGP